MAENWIFMTALLFVSLLFGFHGVVLLIAPDKYLPIVQWGRPAKLELLQKRPLDLGRRFAGLCIMALMGWFFARPAILWMFHPKLLSISRGGSLQPGAVPWEVLLFGLFALGSGLFLMARPEKLVRAMFWADSRSLQNKTTLVLWTVYIQLFAVVCLLMCILFLDEFFKALM